MKSGPNARTGYALHYQTCHRVEGLKERQEEKEENLMGKSILTTSKFWVWSHELRVCVCLWETGSLSSVER